MQTENQLAPEVGNDETGEQGDTSQENYYGNFARRVYYLADVEGWAREKTMRYFNDRKAFEKYYSNVSANTNALLS